MKNKANILLIIGFLLILVFPLININRIKNYVLESEQRTAAEAPKIFNDKGDFILNKQSLESWLNDNIGFRNAFVTLNRFFKKNILKSSTISSVYEGLNDWYFFTGVDNLLLADDNYKIDKQELNTIIKNQIEIKKFYEKNNVEYYLIIPPSKVSVYYENLLPGQTKKTTVTDVLYKELTNVGINIIDLKTPLLKEKNSELLYFKKDTHWNNLGAYTAYREIYKILHENKITRDNMVEVNKDLTKHLGDLSKMVGENKKSNYETSPDIEIVNNLTDKEIIENKLNLNPSEKSLKFKNKKLKNNNLMVMGDSFFGVSKLNNLLSQHFDETYFYWNTYYINDDLIKKSNADIVIMEVTERFYKKLISIKPYE